MACIQVDVGIYLMKNPRGNFKSLRAGDSVGALLNQRRDWSTRQMLETNQTRTLKLMFDKTGRIATWEA
jgi:hypothetical protein